MLISLEMCSVHIKQKSQTMAIDWKPAFDWYLCIN